ncbi:MAG TPA: AtpZ/AtpI family protein [Polyangiaceae bacterium]|nr:AtpZ/AtpI family protein [Polyangiaceae bacterium]
MLNRLGPEGRKQLKESGGAAALGIEMGLAVALGYFMGHWLDGRFETTPYLTYFGLFIGLAAAFKGIYRVSRRYRMKLRTEAASHEISPDA